MVARKESRSEKATRLTAQVQTLVGRDHVEKIDLVMKLFPAMVSNLFDHTKRALAVQGVDIQTLVDASVRAKGAARKPPLALCDGDAEDIFGSGAASSGLHGGSNPRGGDSRMISMVRLDSVSGTLLQTSLHKMEPVVFGVAALKGLLQNGQRVIPRDPLLQLVEFTTGSPRSYLLNISDWENVESRLSDLNEANGRRGMDLVLPPSWGAGRGGSRLRHRGLDTAWFAMLYS
jgi:hypothetical protein